MVPSKLSVEKRGSHPQGLPKRRAALSLSLPSWRDLESLSQAQSGAGQSRSSGPAYKELVVRRVPPHTGVL